MKSYRKKLYFFAVGMIFSMFVSRLTAEVLYVDYKNGFDKNPGTKEKPLRTIAQAASTVNRRKEPGPVTIKIAPGIYNLDKCVFFENEGVYTEKKRLTIEALILPDDPQWHPSSMPVVLSTEDPKEQGKLNALTETYGLRIKNSHVTIRGLKFLGSPVSNNMYCPIERIGDNLEDLVVTQCLFVGDPETLDIYCPIIASGDRLVVDHCIFYNCHASVVFWDGAEAIGGKGNAMEYCIVYGGNISGVWTCQTDEDFKFQHNIITETEYFWMRKPGDQMKYRIQDCIVTNNKYYSGYGIASGPSGQTGPEVAFEEINVIKTGNISLGRDDRFKNYLHIVPGTFGSDLGAGLFKK